jgi:hypothetical protein
MKRLHIALATCAFLSTQAALGQAPTETPVAPTSTVNLSLEQQHTIREFVKELRVPKVAAKFELAVGTAVPASVQLQPMPAEIAEKVPSVKTHRLLVTDSRIALVNPNDPRIAGVIDAESSTGQSNRP